MHVKDRRPLGLKTLAVLSAACCTISFTSLAHADIYRWDDGQLIPGTEGISAAPAVDLSYLQLQYADLTGANLTSARFYATDLTSASFSGAAIDAANFRGAINFTAQQLQTTTTYANHALRGIYFPTFLNLAGFDLTGQDLTSCNLTAANLTSADLTGAIIAGAIIFADGFTAQQLYSTASYQSKNLAGLRLNNGKLTGWNFSGQDLESANFQFANLTSANFANTDLSRARLDLSNLTSANLSGAHLGNVSSSNLTAANLEGALLDGASLTNTTGFTTAQLYSTASYQLRSLRQVFFPNNLSGVDLSRQDLTLAFFQNVDVSSANFASADLSTAFLMSANLAQADLTAANLFRAHLTSANLSGACIAHANLTDVYDFTSDQLYSTASYQQHHLTGISLSRDCTGWNFAGQSMVSANLSRAILTSTNFASADLSLADLRGAIGFVPSSTTLRGAILPDGAVNGFTLHSAEQFYVRSGPDVSVLGPIEVTPGASIVIDPGASVTLAAALALPAGSALKVNGTLTAPQGIVLDGGTLSGIGTVQSSIRGTSTPHTIAPSADLPGTRTATLALAGLSTNPATTLTFKISTPTTSNDMLDVLEPGALTLAGGSIRVVPVIPGVISLGYYKIIRYSGDLAGDGIASLTLPPPEGNIVYSLTTARDAGFIDLHRGFLGDANQDGIVNFSDFVCLSTNYGRRASDWSQADFNNDHVTDFADFVILSNHYGQSLSGISYTATADELAALQAFAATPAAAPEPASLAVLMLGFPILLRRRR
jgi:uncharacterized protein YjbI with pentapeptide repeats